MKKINKKGFTLIELLVVLVILSIIMVIAIPSVTSSIERNKAKHKEQVIKLVESAAELYADSHRNSINDDYCITIANLISEGFVTKDEVKDPLDEDYAICGCVMYKRWSNSVKWSDRESGPECSKDPAGIYTYKIN